MLIAFIMVKGLMDAHASAEVAELVGKLNANYGTADKAERSNTYKALTTESLYAKLGKVSAGSGSPYTDENQGTDYDPLFCDFHSSPAAIRTLSNTVYEGRYDSNEMSEGGRMQYRVVKANDGTLRLDGTRCLGEKNYEFFW